MLALLLLLFRPRLALALLAVLGVTALLTAPMLDRIGSQAAACQRSKQPVTVHVPPKKWPNVADHVHDVRSRYPWILHLDRKDADKHREQSLRGIPTKHGYDRDEYPPAFTREGGTGADVRYVPSSENRSQGSTMGAKLRPYCDGQRFREIAR